MKHVHPQHEDGVECSLCAFTEDKQMEADI